MPIAGAAAGAAQSLEEILAAQMFKAKLAEQQAMDAKRFEMDQARLNESIRQNDLDEKFRVRQEDRVAAGDRQKTNQIGVRRMIGDALQQRQPLADMQGMAFAEGIDLPQAPKVERDPIADHEAKAKIDAKYREPKAAPAPERRRPEWVKMPDGSFKDLNAVAPEGARPFDAVGERQAPEKEAAKEAARAAMQTYGDNLLSVIDDLIDEDGNLKPDVAGVVGGFDGARPDWAYAKESSNTALAKIDRLKAMLNIDTIRDMKAQSRTGATGYGAMNEKEFGTIESASSTLKNRRQGDAAFAAEVKRVRDEIRANRGQGGKKPENKPGGGDAAAAAQALIDKARAARGKP